MERHPDYNARRVVDRHPRPPVALRILSVWTGHRMERHQVLADTPVLLPLRRNSAGGDARAVARPHHLEARMLIRLANTRNAWVLRRVLVWSQATVCKRQMALVDVTFHRLDPVR